jgi:hypothetical protein
LAVRDSRRVRQRAKGKERGMPFIRGVSPFSFLR